MTLTVQPEVPIVHCKPSTMLEAAAVNAAAATWCADAPLVSETAMPVQTQWS